MPHEPARVLRLDLFLGDTQAYRDALARYETIRPILKQGRTLALALGPEHLLLRFRTYDEYPTEEQARWRIIELLEVGFRPRRVAKLLPSAGGALGAPHMMAGHTPPRPRSRPGWGGRRAAEPALRTHGAAAPLLITHRGLRDEHTGWGR